MAYYPDKRTFRGLKKRKLGFSISCLKNVMQSSKCPPVQEENDSTTGDTDSTDKE